MRNQIPLTLQPPLFSSDYIIQPFTLDPHPLSRLLQVLCLPRQLGYTSARRFHEMHYHRILGRQTYRTNDPLTASHFLLDPLQLPSRIHQLALQTINNPRARSRTD